MPSAQPAPEIITLQDLPTEIDLVSISEHFTPTPRFSRVSFDSYQPDPAYPSQQAARRRMKAFAEAAAETRSGLERLKQWLPWSDAQSVKGLYLDGGYGVGKTHLLAAAYHHTHASKAYLTFADLTYVIGLLGIEKSVKAFSEKQLICLDEFELDDVANTRLAANFLKRFFRLGDHRVITTSNTLPSQLGQGRFAAHDFQREIGQIASLFEVVTIDGRDYRKRQQPAAEDPHINRNSRLPVLDPDEFNQQFEREQPQYGAKIQTRFDSLCRYLSKLHPIRYSRSLEPVESFFIQGLKPIPDQHTALRFVHFIDKVYEQEIRLFVTSTCSLENIFLAEYRNKGYKKKYQRCLSRLHELLWESRRKGRGLNRGRQTSV